MCDMVAEEFKVEYGATIEFDGKKENEIAINEIVQKLQDLPYDIIGALPGGELGIALMDQIAERLGLIGNSTEKSLARRNKYVMGEICKIL